MAPLFLFFAAFLSFLPTAKDQAVVMTGAKATETSLTPFGYDGYGYSCRPPLVTTELVPSVSRVLL